MSALLLPQPKSRISRARVTLTFADGTVVKQGDTEAKAELFDKLLASLDNRQLLQLSQAISELSLSRTVAEKARELVVRASEEASPTPPELTPQATRWDEAPPR